TTRLIAEAKARVVNTDFKEKKVKEVAESIKKDGGKAAFIKVDVSNSEQVQEMVKFAVDTYGKLDIGVNNAALTPDDKPSAEFDEDYWDRLMAVDLKGAGMKYELQQMLKQGNGG